MDLNNFDPPQLVTSAAVTHSVLGSWMINRLADDVSYLQPEHFPMETEQAVWRAALKLEAQGINGDVTALVEELKRNANVKDVDWLLYCARVIDDANQGSAMSFEKNAETVYDNARRLKRYREFAQKALDAADLSIPLPLEETAEIRGRQRLSAGEIMEMDIPAPGGVWPGVIPVGLTVLGARPKIGKSLLMLQFSGALGSGGMFFGQQLPQERVLYYALEDGNARLKQRLRQMGIPRDARVDFEREITPLDRGGIEQLEMGMKRYKLIVLDTLVRAMGGKDIINEAATYGQMLNRMQKAALDNYVSIVVVSHNRKPNGMDGDPINDVMGTTSMTAPADSVLGMYLQKDHYCQLKGRARDSEDVDVTMRMDPATLCWDLVGATAQLPRSDNEAAILSMLRSVASSTATDLANALGAKRTNTCTRLKHLCERGVVARQVIKGVAHYSLQQAPLFGTNQAACD